MAFSDLLNKPFSDLTKAQFLSFLQNQFLKWFFTPVFDKDNVVANYVRDLQFIKQVNILWSADDLEDLIVLEIIKQNKWDSRIWLTSEIFKLISNNDFLNKPRFNVLAIVRSEKEPEQWRLSLVTSEGKTKSNPRRFSFILWVNEKIRTPKQQLMDKWWVTSFDDLKERFNVEVVRDQFFNLYINLFLEVYDAIITNDVFDWIIKKKELEPISFAKNLMGKIVFLHFIQKKGWLWIDENWKFWEWDRRFFKNNLDTLTTKWDLFNKRTNFYNDFLEPLFYDGLNKEHENDWNEELQMKIPYLNWWLFQEEYDWRNTTINLDNDIFKAIIESFDVYNFTIDEWDIYDREIAVDPEMLWRLFEKMIWFNVDNQEVVDRVLKEYKEIKKKKKINMPNPDHIIDLDLWKEKNKKLWAFYTPREIVWYMARESIIEYLVSKLWENSRNTIIQLFKYKDEYLSKQEIEKKANEIDNQLDSLETKITYSSLKHDVFDIIEYLNDIKVLDPAIGSWAFPMWILQELVSLKEYLINVFWLEKKSVYEIKRDIIQNNIFWVDIDPWAVSIARLRFWLWLVVDEKQPEPLPNLDFKFICANSLIPLAEKKENEQDEYTKEANLDTLRKYKREYYNESDKTKKQQLAERIRNYRSESNNLFLSISSLRTQQISEFLQNFNKPEHVHSFFDPKLMFSEWNWFNVIIWNPPYIKEYDNRDAFNWFRENSPYYMWKMDLRYWFACYWLDLLKENGILTFIAQNNRTTSAWAKIMRNKVISSSRIIQLLDFNTYMVFENAQIQTMIMVFQKNKKIDNYKVDYRKLLNWANETDMLKSLERVKTNSINYFSPIISRESYENKLLTFSENDEIFDKISLWKAYFTDDEVAQWIVFPQDFVDKKRQLILWWNYKIWDWVFALSDSELKNMNLSHSEKTLIKPLFTTEQIGKYHTANKNSQWLIYTDSSFKDPKSMNKYPILKKHLDQFQKIITSDNKPYWLHRARKQHFFQWEKIISLRKCPDYPMFSYSDFDCYVTQTFFVIQSVRWNMKFLTWLLNSKLIAFRLKNKWKMQWNNFQIDKEPLQSIPLPNMKWDDSVIVPLVDKILSKKSVDINANISELEKMVDNEVYRLYWLTDEEIQIVEDSVK